MKTVLLVVGVAMFILGIQDGIRLVVDTAQASIFSWIAADASLYIALDVALVVSGAALASYGSKKVKAAK